MPHVSSIFPKLVSAVTIVMASSDVTRNAMKCEFFRNKIVLPSIKANIYKPGLLELSQC